MPDATSGAPPDPSHDPVGAAASPDRPGPAGRGLPWHVDLTIAAGAVAAQCLVLYLPGAAVPVVSVPGADKVVHVAAFAIPTWALLRAVRGRRLVLLLLGAHAIVSELVQEAWIPRRGGDPFDLAADAAGIALGWAASRRAADS